MDLVRHLRAFLAVAEEEHLSRGASRLGVAQPVVSRQLKTLESTLAVRLLDRSGRRIALTEEARQLVPLARDLVDRADQILAIGRLLATAGRNGLRLVVPAAADVYAMADAIRLTAEHHLTLSLAEAAEGERRARLADGAADWALVRVSAVRAEFVVPLGFGVASAPQPAADERTRSLYLDALRPRAGRRRGPVILVQPEDALPLMVDDLTRAAARAGLTADQVETVQADTLAPSRVLAGEDLLLCSRAEAYRFGLDWRPSADRLQRCYALEAAHPHTLPVPPGLMQILRRAFGGRPPVSRSAHRPPPNVPAGLFG